MGILKAATNVTPNGIKNWFNSNTSKEHAFNLVDFRHWTKDFARGHHFLMGIGDLPLYDKSISRTLASSEFSPHLSVYVSATSLPTSDFNIGFALLQKGNIAYRYPMDKIFSPWTVTFLCDSNHLLRNTFLQWQERIFDTKHKTHQVPSRYLCNQLWVGQLSPNSNCPLISCVFRGAWPSGVGAVKLEQADAGISTFDVTFSYNYYEYAHVDGDDALQAMEKRLASVGGNKSTKGGVKGFAKKLLTSELDFIKSRVGAAKCKLQKLKTAPASSGLLPDIGF